MSTQPSQLSLVASPGPRIPKEPFNRQIRASLLSESLYAFALDPSSIYSCSIVHILEHEFCHLGCWALLEKISETTEFVLKYATFWGGFFMFSWAKKDLTYSLKTL